MKQRTPAALKQNLSLKKTIVVSSRPVHTCIWNVTLSLHCSSSMLCQPCWVLSTCPQAFRETGDLFLQHAAVQMCSEWIQPSVPHTSCSLAQRDQEAIFQCPCIPQLYTWPWKLYRMKGNPLKLASWVSRLISFQRSHPWNIKSSSPFRKPLP